MIVHKGATYEFDTRDWNRPFATKYGSGLAMYLDLLPFDATDADEEDYIEGEHAYRFGRRILWADSQGFIDITTHDSVDTAKATMSQLFHDWHYCPECSAYDTDPDHDTEDEFCSCECHDDYA